MKRISAALIVALLSLLPLTAMGNDNLDIRPYEDSRKQYMQAPEEYRATAEELRGKKDHFNGRQREIIDELIGIYMELAENKVMLADAIGKDNENSLVGSYYALRVMEGWLWEAWEEETEG